MALDRNYSLETLAVREGQERSQFNEHSEALYLTSSFVFDSAAQAAARFSGEEAGNVYSRFTNPTVAAFQDRLAALEGAEACVATASGMSAILSLVMALCSSGDHVVASTGLFGATQQLLGTIMPRFGIRTTFVAQTDVAAWQTAMLPETKLFFLETPSNPLTEIADIAALVGIARAHGASWWRSTTASAHRSCNDRSTLAPTSSSIRRPSSSMVRGGSSAVPLPGPGYSPTRCSSFCEPPGRRFQPSTPGYC
jgi:O-succinylhomoserine sulfhydrylase